MRQHSIASRCHPQVCGPAPAPRVGHCAWYMSDGIMLLFGGFTKEGGYSNALHALRGSNPQSPDPARPACWPGDYEFASRCRYALHIARGLWSQPTVRCDEGSAPPLSRLGLSATALHEAEALLFGGSHHGRPCDALDLLRVVGELGSPQSALHVAQPATQGAPPAARFNHGAAPRAAPSSCVRTASS